MLEILALRARTLRTERERESGGVCLEIEGLETEVPVCVLCVCVGYEQSPHSKENVRVVAGVRFLGSDGRICFSGVAGVKSCRVDPNVRIAGNSSSPLHLMISRTCFMISVCFEREMN